MAVPDFLVIGNPRSGTSWLDGLLGAHPDIFMAWKELTYFGSDLDFDVPRRSWESYQYHLAGARPGQLIGESSVWYLHSRTAAREAHALNPDLRAVVVLREPVEWLRSLHAMLVHYAEEDIEDFGAALAVSDSRLAAGHGPTTSPPYLHLVRYAEQVQRWREQLGAERVQVLFFEEMREAPATEVARVFAFLGVDPAPPGLRDALGGTRGTRNANRKPRSRRLQRLLTSHRAKRILRRHDHGPPGARSALRVLRRLNHRLIERVPPDEGLSAELRARFRPECDLLEAVLDRPVPPSWRGTP